VLPKVKSGLWAKPLWYEGARRSPPQINYIAPAPPKVVLPEDNLYETLLARKPMLELEMEKPLQTRRTIGHRFALAQHKLMRTQQMSEEDAYDQVNKAFAHEIKTFERSLDQLHEDGVERVSFNTIKRNVSQSARVGNSIVQLLEKRIDMEMGGALYLDPLFSSKDTYHRRRAKLQRLARDPAISYIKGLFKPKKPQVLKALEVLVSDPKSADTAYWNDQLRKFMRTLQFQLYNVRGNTSEARTEELGKLKTRVLDVAKQVKTQPWSRLSVQAQTEVISIAQTALKAKVLPANKQPFLRVSTERQAIQQRIRGIREGLEKVESDRSMKEIMGKGYGDFLESSWWNESKERVEFLAEVEKHKAENPGGIKP